MKQTHIYLVPDYYPEFSCKCGACRAACCVGWPISLSMNDYFHLLGVNCSKKLRARLDCAMRLADNPTAECYARINPRYDGQCPVRMDDGRCGVQAELGEDALSAVCRLYPRAPRAEGDYECSCANSCERVVEMLIARTQPLAFIQMPLTFNLPQATARTVFFETVGREQEIRLYLIGKMQDRSLPMPERLDALGRAMGEVERALHDKDEARIERILTGDCAPGEAAKPAGDKQNLTFGLRIAQGFVSLLDERSHSIEAYGREALAYFGDAETALPRYRAARERFEALFPDWPAWFERLLSNHMFFERFPFQDRPVSLRDEFTALCAVYGLLRFLALGCMAVRGGINEFVDMTAAAFRLIDHTSFDRYAARMLNDLGCRDLDTLYMMTQL